jgi:hypothetical protein
MESDDGISGFVMPLSYFLASIVDISNVRQNVMLPLMASIIRKCR